jgi:DNA-binding HxlR family transcriptional regulator
MVSGSTPQPAEAASSEPDEANLVRCSSAARALNIVGDRWTLLALYAAFLGARRFDDLIRVTGMARSLLVDRLRRLETHGLIEKQPYQTRPLRNEYRLTRAGSDLYDAAQMILRWEKTWHYDPACPSHNIVHTCCGRPLTPVMVCGACALPVKVRDVELRPGPGAGFEPAAGPRLQRRSTVGPVGAQPLHPMLERTIEVLGDRWTTHVVAAAFYGHTRFLDFQAELKVASNILADRLARLCERGILERRLYQNRPERWDYKLTREARDLFPLIVALMTWGDRWLAGGNGPPEVLIHRPCGQTLSPVIRCEACGAPSDLSTTRLG